MSHDSLKSIAVKRWLALHYIEDHKPNHELKLCSLCCLKADAVVYFKMWHLVFHSSLNSLGVFRADPRASTLLPRAIFSVEALKDVFKLFAIFLSFRILTRVLRVVHLNFE